MPEWGMTLTEAPMTDDARVAVPSSRIRSGGEKRYHTTECQAFPSRPVYRLLEALGDEWSECLYCTGEAPNPQVPPDMSYYEAAVEAGTDG